MEVMQLEFNQVLLCEKLQLTLATTKKTITPLATTKC